MRGTGSLHVSQWAVTQPEHRVEIMSDISALLTKELFFSQNTPPPFLPCQPTVPMPDFEGQMRKERAAPPPLSNWFKQALGGAGLVVCVGCGLLSMPSEEESLVMATQWVLPSAERVCALLARGPFPSSLVSSQINLLWSEHTLTRSLYTTTAALRSTAVSSQAHIGISSCMQKKKEQ